MIALGVLLVLRRKLRDARVGILFVLLSLFYAFNIYGDWMPVGHPRAVFGFVFYLWLGAWGAWHFADVQKWLEHIPAMVMLCLVVLTNALALVEARVLVSLRSEDPLNTLRITNQVASVVVVLAIMKLKRAVWPRFVDVRGHTFGLYLTHTVALALLLSTLVRVQRIATGIKWSSLPFALIVLPSMFVVVYGSCLLLVRFILSRAWLRWTVGLAGSGRSAPRSRTQEVEKTAGAPLSPGGFAVQVPLARSK